MFRKTLTVLAAVAVIGGAGAGVAYADTPAPSKLQTCTATILSNCIGTGTILGGGLLGGGHDGHGHNRGGHFPGGLGGRFGGTYWQRGGVILPYSSVAGSCGCSDPVSLGYTLVEQPAQVQVVPLGVEAGDGSCALNTVNWGDSRFSRGVRFFRR